MIIFLWFWLFILKLIKGIFEGKNVLIFLFNVLKCLNFDNLIFLELILLYKSLIFKFFLSLVLSVFKIFLFNLLSLKV